MANRFKWYHVTITVAVANDAPVVSGNDVTLAYTENDQTVLIDSALRSQRLARFTEGGEVTFIQCY